MYAQDSADYAADLPSSLYDKTLEHDALVSTHAEVLMELQTLIGVVDGLDAS